MSNPVAKSPLRYPGGKSRAVELILDILPLTQINEICSPFLGGASIELACVSQGIKVYGYDVFQPLVDFWQCLVKDANKLADLVAKYHPLSKDVFYRLQKEQSSIKDKFERAAVFYVLNRSSFSGSTLSGGMSPGHGRFTESSIQRLRDFKVRNFEVKKMDFKKSILSHKDVFLYLDPPYLISSSLYGVKGNTHKNFDHVGLSELLKKRDNWILSYNNCDEIRTLYKGFKACYPQWKYGMSSLKESKEILIVNTELNRFFEGEIL